jgi:tetratricopeptide (TPR) repeat protein
MEDKKHLAELFGLVQPDPEEHEGAKPKRKGRNAEESARFGDKAMRDGEFALAIEHYERAVEQGGNARYGFDLAAAHDAAGNEELAEQLFAEAASTNKDAAEPHAALGDIYKRNARFQDAVEELHRAIATEPSNPIYHFKLAETLREMKMTTDAIRSAERAALCQPDNAFFHYWLADLLIETQRYTEALEPLKMAVELSPGDDFLYLLTAVAFWGAGRQKDALKAIRLASELSPENKLFLAIERKFSNLSLGEQADLPEMDAYDRDRYDVWMKRLGIGD